MARINYMQAREKYNRLNQMLQEAVLLLEDFIVSEPGRRAEELGEFARFYAFEHQDKLMAAGRVGCIHYMFYKGRYMLTSALPENKPIAVAIYNGSYIEDRFGWNNNGWEINISESWLTETSYLALKYQTLQEE